MTSLSRLILAAGSLAALAACEDKEAIARADSLQSQLTEQQTLALTLQAQKDSLTRVVVDADAFLGQMDSAISTVRGLPRSRRTQSDPLADQLRARKEMQDRVNALVTRAKETATQLAALQRQKAVVDSTNLQLQQELETQTARIADDAQLIADLGATIERQNRQIAVLEARLDSLGAEVRALGTRHYRAYFVIGSEKELTDRGVAVKEGGANLLFARPGRTLVPARVLDPAAFTEIDQRETTMIQVPDTSRRYRIISRQTLDAAEVEARDGSSFKGHLKITKPDEFWGPARFLILLRQ